MLGSCIPLVLNHEAKVQYFLKMNVSRWINYIVQKRHYAAGMYNQDQLFNFNLEIKYSSEEYGEFIDTFEFEWIFNGIWAEDGEIKYNYVLKNTKSIS